MNAVRLSDFEIEAIKDIVSQYDEEAKIMVFGSRADLTKMGGDIDLLVFSKKLSGRHGRLIRYDLWDKIGEQKIDVVVAAEHTEEPFVNLVKDKGVYI